MKKVLQPRGLKSKILKDSTNGEADLNLCFRHVNHLHHLPHFSSHMEMFLDLK